MKVSTKRKNGSCFVLTKPGHGEQYDPREIELLSAGKVPMLLSPQSISEKSGTLQYDVSPYIPLDIYLSYDLSEGRLAELLLRFIQLFRCMKKEYLNYKNLVLDLNKIFVLYIDRTIHLIYLPMMDSQREVSIPDFFRVLIGSANRNNHDRVNRLNACEQWLNRPQPFVLDEFESFLQQLFHTEEKAEKSVMKQRQEMYRPYPPAERESFSDIRDELQEISDRLSRDTANRAEQRKPQFYLKREQTGEMIALSFFPFLIGSAPEKVHYRISGNETVSRRHVLFRVNREDECVIADQGSTNGTFVNGYALRPYEEKTLADGDTIKIATESFVFSKGFSR